MAETSDDMVLYVWPGEWELPSLDAECLCTMCYLKFTELPHKIVQVRNPFLLFKSNFFNHNSSINFNSPETLCSLRYISSISPQERYLHRLQ